MAGVVVVGGGYGGLASAARLAKQGHAVTLVESGARLGGALERVVRGDFAWDAGPSSTLLPAVVRDLFRKTGRPLERELTLEHRDLVREHRFADGTSLRLPGSSREAQAAAVDDLSPGSGRRGWPTSRRTPRPGSCCGASTSSVRGCPPSPTGPPAPSSSPASRWPGGRGARSATAGSGRSRRGPPWPRATTPGRCRPGSA
ncbi:FAD-dependent oxidoreductase [Nocardioides zeae]